MKTKSENHLPHLPQKPTPNINFARGDSPWSRSNGFCLLDWNWLILSISTVGMAERTPSKKLPEMFNPAVCLKYFRFWSQKRKKGWKSVDLLGFTYVWVQTNQWYIYIYIWSSELAILLVSQNVLDPLRWSHLQFFRLDIEIERLSFKHKQRVEKEEYL